MNDRLTNTTRTNALSRYDDYEIMYDPDVAEAERSSNGIKNARPKARKKEDKSILAGEPSTVLI